MFIRISIEIARRKISLHCLIQGPEVSPQHSQNGFQMFMKKPLYISVFSVLMLKEIVHR